MRFRRGDFFAQSWRGHVVIYAFLSPVPMARVWEKAQRELPAGATVISNSFPVPGAAPERTVEVPGELSQDTYGPVRVEKLSRIRKTIAARMHEVGLNDRREAVIEHH